MKSRPASRPVLVALLGGTLACSPLSTAAGAQAAGAAATQALLEKAHTLETRGRLDIASQTWQQVLLSDPNNTQALAGLARASKSGGDNALANSYLERLRAISPNDPGIARVEKVGTDQGQNAQLQQAGKFAQAGQYAQAMAIYRKVFGDHPPSGDWALAYYETEAATDAGRSHAITGLRSLVDKYPADSRYQIALGRILTYNPKTRADGRRYLERYASSPQATEALRQSLIWDSANPASAADIRAYLARHNDPQLAEAIRNQPKVAPKPVAEKGSGADPDALTLLAERRSSVAMEEAYKALNGKHLEDAESRFKAILTTQPESPRALAGMGYIRMQQSNFGSAVSFLEQAQQNGARDPGLAPALATAHFWTVMGEAGTALNDNDLPLAEQGYQAALALKPGSPEAVEGLGGTLLKAQQNGAAAEVFERLVGQKPGSAPAWRDLFQSYSNAGDAPHALATERRFPATVRAQLLRDPEFLRALAAAYSAVGRDADAQRVLRSALDLPFPVDAHGLKVETELQYAALLQQANHLDQAAGLYRQVLAVDPGNSGAWQGLIRVQHTLHSDAQAADTLASMPPSVYQSAMRETGFASTVAGILEATNHPDTAQDLLERIVAQQAASNQKPSVGLELQLAGLYLARNNTAKAYPIYREVLAESPDRTDAWKGILSALHSSGRDTEALAQAQQIPAAVRSQLELDPEYLQTLGAVYNGLGQPQEAALFINRVQQHYAAQNTAAPSDIDIQDAWLLFNSGNDTGLYRQLMLLGSRPDLADEQRRTVQTIWTNWAVRRANQTAAGGDTKRSLAILNAAAKSFPNNPGVLRALASGYARAGLPGQAVAIFKTQDMTAATAADYKAAVGAALASNDQKQAEIWLRYGLDTYPRDAQMLTLGARFEQAHGNNTRAADYFRASLAALPPGDPGSELAGELSLPAPAVRLPSTAQPQDLATLLGGGSNASADTASSPAQPEHPYLPSYNNLSGPAPVSARTGPGGQSSLGPLPVLPSYMGNPASRPASPVSPRPSALRDYVPPTAQASLSQPLARQPLPPAPLTSSLPFTPSTPGSALPPALPTRNTLTATAQPEPARAVSPQTLYGPYVPYVPPSSTPAYAPTAVPVQLGRDAGAPALQQSEVTDVLPRQRYLPGSPYKPDARTGVVSGRAGDDSLVQPPTRNAQFTAAADPAAASGQQYPQPDVAPSSTSSNVRHRRAASSRLPASPTSEPAPAAPLVYPSVHPALTSLPYPSLPAALPEGSPPTDADLVAKDLPPLRGSYDPALASGVVPAAKSEREQTERDLASLESSYSGWVGGTGVARYRSGTPGFDRLVDIEAPVEASAVLGKSTRVTVIPRPVFLNSGVINSAAIVAAGGTAPILGTFSGSLPTTPTEQFSSGVGGELQLTTAHIGLAAGYTPYSFLVSNVTARAQFRLGHLTLFGDRDSVKDTQLSYSGLRDPATVSALYGGNISGGVISTTAGARLDVGSEKSGFYLSGDGGTLTGYHVLSNEKQEGTMGAYFRAHRWPGYGTLNVGGNFYAMHYDHNERGLTYGQGGYFSPNVYFLASVPLTYTGSYTNDFHYTVNASVGVQTFQEDAAPFFPLDRALQLGFSNQYYPVNSGTGVNYSLNSEGSYRIADHWYVGGFASANNSRNYDTVNGGFFVRYLFREQLSDDTAFTGLFPVTGFRPLRVP